MLVDSVWQILENSCPRCSICRVGHLLDDTVGGPDDPYPLQSPSDIKSAMATSPAFLRNGRPCRRFSRSRLPVSVFSITNGGLCASMNASGGATGWRSGREFA
jgi:hypothetical protein